MKRTVFTKDLADQVRGLVGWSIGIALTVVIMGAFWPAMSGIPDFESFIEAYPEEMRRLFRIEGMTSGTGYFNVELFSLMLPIIFIIFGVARGSRLLAGEEEMGTLEILASLSVARARILLEKTAVLIASLFILGVVTFLASWATSALFDMSVAPDQLAAGTTAMMLLGLEFGAVALAVGAVTGKRAVALTVASSLALASYLLYVAGVMVAEAQEWRVLSPFQQALEGGPLGGGFRAAFLWMLAVAVLTIAVALPVFERRDIRG